VTQADAPADRLDTFDERLPYRIVRPYRVRFEESTASETTRTAIYLAWAADVAWQHSALVGFDRPWYSSRGLFWLVRAVRLDVLVPIPTYSSVKVSTQVVGYRRLAARRRSEIRDESGRLLALLEIDWVMTNARGVPTRVPEEMLRFIEDGSTTFEMRKVCLPPTPAGAHEATIVVSRRDLDPMAHVNNSVYLDYLEETLESAGCGALLNEVPRRYEVDFLSSAEGGDELLATAWPHAEAWFFTLRRADGTSLFRARVQPLPSG
jgi:acyl-CoA thioesterase FadM